MSEITPTRSAYLELQQERIGMEEGYRFLDEKRMVLVAETLQELERYEAQRREFMDAFDLAIQALQRAVGRHGIHGLEIYPPESAAWQAVQRESRSVLGLKLETASLERHKDADQKLVINASPEAEEARRLFARLIPFAARLAAISGNLLRLRNEYQRTSRRARALEDVLLPEIDQTITRLDTALEEMDKEEFIRVHLAIQR